MSDLSNRTLGVDFWIADADPAAKNAAAMGDSVVAGPHDLPGFRQAVLVDPGRGVHGEPARDRFAGDLT